MIGVRDNDLPAGFGETGLALWHFNTGPGAYERLPTFGTDGVAGFLGARATGFATWLPGTAVRLACLRSHQRLWVSQLGRARADVAIAPFMISNGRHRPLF